MDAITGTIQGDKITGMCENKDLSEDKKMDDKKENWCDKCHVKDDCEDKETFLESEEEETCAGYA